MQNYDTIIVGGGHNGLVCAAYLAAAGQRVVLLEAHDSFGGLAATREFHPGFKVSVAHSLYQFSARIAAELKLEKYGYGGPGAALATTALAADGAHVSFAGDVVSGVGADDRAAYARYRNQMLSFAAALESSWLKTMPRIGNNSAGELLQFAQIGFHLMRLGRQDMLEFFRVAALPARDLMDENFNSDLLKAALSWDGLIGSRQAPRSPNNTVLNMLYRMSGAAGGDHSLPAGGIESLVQALVAAATAAGAELRSGQPVQRILLSESEQGLQTAGVELADGETLHCERVVSATDPKRTFLDLVGARYLDIEFTNRIRRLRGEGLVAKLHLALADVPAFSGVGSPDGRLLVAPELDALEFAFDHAKYGELPEQPLLELLLPSLHQRQLAPTGQHVLSAHIMYVPYALKGGWTDAARQQLLGRVLAQLEHYAPGIGQLVLAAELLTPADLERDWRVSGGHWHHGELAMDQMLMMRPTYGAAQYATPIPGLYLCSAGSHPGGGLMGGPGHNAAREILR